MIAAEDVLRSVTEDVVMIVMTIVMTEMTVTTVTTVMTVIGGFVIEFVIRVENGPVRRIVIVAGPVPVIAVAIDLVIVVTVVTHLKVSTSDFN